MNNFCFFLFILYVLVSCDQPVKGDLEQKMSPLNNVIINEALSDSLASFDRILQKKFKSSYIIAVDIRQELNNVDSIKIYLSQVLNRSELAEMYPSYVAFSGETPVFIFTGFESLVAMPKSFIEMVKVISSENLVNDTAQEELPPTTYTPIVKQFSIARE